MAQAPPTFVSNKNDANTSPAHLHRQIELQSNAQTPFLEAYVSTGSVAASGIIKYDTVVKDTFKRYDKPSGIYVFPVNGFWSITAWMQGAVALNLYWTPLDFANPAPNIFANGIGPATCSPATATTVTWQLYAGPTVSARQLAPGLADMRGPNAMAVVSNAASSLVGPYLCQLDLTCMAQY